MGRTIKKTVVNVLGWMLAISGLILFILPLPFGIPLFAVGLVMLISTSKTARRGVLYLRTRFERVDRLFTLVETNVPGPTRSILRKTRRRSLKRRQPAS